MNPHVTVREYASLIGGDVAFGPDTLDSATVSTSAFKYLCKLSASFRSSGARLLQLDGHLRLRLDNFVGVIQTPCGTTIEILPKHQTEGGSVDGARRLLRRMIAAALNLPTRQVGDASLQKFDAPLTEWLIRRFLEELEILMRRGIRFEYVRRKEALPYLKGQLDLQAQLRRRPGQDVHFDVRHNVYIADRPENRLLRLAADICRRETRDPDNWRLANELCVRLVEIEPSRQVELDFQAWGADRLLAHYRPIRPWCEWVVRRVLPLSVHGPQMGSSLLFPMERLYEAYVARCLRRQLSTEVLLRRAPSFLSLCEHEAKPLFALEPDFLAQRNDRLWVLDAKWKLLNELNRKDKYGISQSDFYQLFVYGEKYLKGSGDMALIYPRTAEFQSPLPVFQLSDSLGLWVLPFDLEGEQILGIEKLGCPVRLGIDSTVSDAA